MKRQQVVVANSREQSKTAIDERLLVEPNQKVPLFGGQIKRAVVDRIGNGCSIVINH